MAMAQLEHHYIEVNGLTLHVVQSGPLDGPLVILLHGFPEFWYGWQHQLEFLAETGYRVWIPDQRGYNLSDKPTSVRAYHLNTLTADVVELIKAAGRQKAFLVGHDWGALVAWWLATDSPANQPYSQWLDGLVILNAPHPVVSLRAILKNPSQILKSWYIYFFQIPRLPEFLIERMERRRQFGRGGLQASSRPGTFSSADLEEYHKAWLQPGALRGMVNWYRAFGRYFVRLAQATPTVCISVPTLILWGAKDAFINPINAELSQQACENARLVFFEDATHWVQHEKAAEVNVLMADFFASLRSKTKS